MCFSFCIDIFSKNDQEFERKSVKPIKRADTTSQIKGRVSGEF